MAIILQQCPVQKTIGNGQLGCYSKLAITVALVLLGCSTAAADNPQYNKKVMFTIASDYVLSIYPLLALAESECSYAIYKKVILSSVLAEIKPKLEKDEFDEIVSSVEKKHASILSRFAGLVREQIDGIKKSGLDDKTNCGIQMGMAAANVMHMKKRWKVLSDRHGKK